jgi:hypothetical protein
MYSLHVVASTWAGRELVHGKVGNKDIRYTDKRR